MWHYWYTSTFGVSTGHFSVFSLCCNNAPLMKVQHERLLFRGFDFITVWNKTTVMQIVFPDRSIEVRLWSLLESLYFSISQVICTLPVGSWAVPGRMRTAVPRQGQSEVLLSLWLHEPDFCSQKTGFQKRKCSPIMQQLQVQSGYRAMTGEWDVFCGDITFSLILVCLLCACGKKGDLAGSTPWNHHSSKQGTGLWQSTGLHSWALPCQEVKMMGGGGCAAVLTSSSHTCAVQMQVDTFLGYLTKLNGKCPM